MVKEGQNIAEEEQQSKNLQRRVLETSLNTEQPRRITQLGRNPQKVSREHNNPLQTWKK